MERIHALIDKLYQQKQQNCSPAQLLLTIQLLQSEILNYQQKNGSLGKGKVAVTLPVNLNFAEEVLRISQEEIYDKEEMLVTEPVKNVIAQPVSPSFTEKRFDIPEPVISKEVFEEQRPASFAAPQRVLNPAFDTISELPALAQYQPSKKEIHEVIGEQKESLNDKLKQEKTEVVHVLKDTPIKDLRKGIGINDRFTFVNELFRGDEAMYERSIKTINGFTVLSEAEYWIHRELTFKLGWNDSRENVQHFYQLVKRRFA